MSRFIGFAFTMIVALVMTTNQANAHHNSRAAIGQYAKDLACAAAEMRDEVKIHFRDVKGHVRLSVDALQIKVKAAAICRRVKRDPCYRGLERDVAKLSQRVCEFLEQYNEVLACGGCCIKGDTRHVTDLVVCINELSNCIQANLNSEVVILPQLMGPEVQIIEEIQPNIELVPPVQSSQPRSVLQR